MGIQASSRVALTRLTDTTTTTTTAASPLRPPVGPDATWRMFEEAAPGGDGSSSVQEEGGDVYCTRQKLNSYGECSEYMLKC